MDRALICGKFVQKIDELYEVDKKGVLGKGKFGTVYKGRCKITGRECAVKVIRKIRQDRNDVKREMNIFKRISENPHKNIACLLDWFETRREYVIATELLKGGELFYFLEEKGFLCEADAVIYVRQIAQALQHLKGLNICHLDLKPENLVLLDEASQIIKLVDFGAARDLSGEKGETRTLVGTPEFVAPEVLAYNPISQAADMWGLGVITYVMLSGLSPFLGDSDSETLANVTRADFYFPEDDFPPVSEDARNFICQLLIKNPRKRMTAEQALQHPWLQPGNKRISQFLISTEKLKSFNGRQKIMVTFYVVHFAIKLMSLRNKQLKQLHHDKDSCKSMPNSNPLSPTHNHPTFIADDVDDYQTLVRYSLDTCTASTENGSAGSQTPSSDILPVGGLENSTESEVSVKLVHAQEHMDTNNVNCPETSPCSSPFLNAPSNHGNVEIQDGEISSNHGNTETSVNVGDGEISSNHGNTETSVNVGDGEISSNHGNGEIPRSSNGNIELPDCNNHSNLSNQVTRFPNSDFLTVDSKNISNRSGTETDTIVSQQVLHKQLDPVIFDDNFGANDTVTELKVDYL